MKKEHAKGKTKSDIVACELQRFGYSVDAEKIERDQVWVKLNDKNDLHAFVRRIQTLGFDHCSCISAVDYPPERFTIVYSFWSTKRKCGICATVDIGRDGKIPSIAGFYGGANWQERESYDLMGIVFEGHPDLRRVLLSEDTKYHPLRKDFRHPYYPEKDTNS